MLEANRLAVATLLQLVFLEKGNPDFHGNSCQLVQWLTENKTTEAQLGPYS